MACIFCNIVARRSNVTVTTAPRGCNTHQGRRVQTFSRAGEPRWAVDRGSFDRALTRLLPACADSPHRPSCQANTTLPPSPAVRQLLPAPRPCADLFSAYKTAHPQPHPTSAQASSARRRSRSPRSTSARSASTTRARCRAVCACTRCHSAICHSLLRKRLALTRASPAVVCRHLRRHAGAAGDAAHLADDLELARWWHL